jgi:hypothetical protein
MQGRCADELFEVERMWLAGDLTDANDPERKSGRMHVSEIDY